MFPFSENPAFWLFTLAVSAITYLVMRRHVHKRLVIAPQASLRSPIQRAMHWMSLLLLVIPLGYVTLINGEPFWAAFAILWAQAGSMLLLRLLKISYTIRVWLLLPISVASVFVGAIVAVWPSFDNSMLQAAPWLFLFLAALAFALSGLISLYSFPIGYGERAR
jgi:hypothetical protein